MTIYHPLPASDGASTVTLPPGTMIRGVVYQHDLRQWKFQAGKHVLTSTQQPV